MKRVFLVGAPHSGTALLQSLLAAHPAVVSFPESHFAPALLSESRSARALGLAAHGARARLVDFLRTVGRPDLEAELPRMRTVEEHVHAFVAMLDRLAAERSAEAWIEATSRHLHHMDLLERCVPGAHFLHLVREGRDVAASLYEATRRNAQEWRGPWDLARCCQRWLDDLRATRSRAGAANHLSVRYEDLVEDPGRELLRICRSLGLEFDAAMLSDYREAAADVALEGEPQRGRAQEPIEKSRQGAFARFDASQRAFVERVLGRVESGRGDSSLPTLVVHAPRAPGNPYQSLLAAHLAATGIEAVVKDADDWYAPPTPRREWPDVLHLHGLEPFLRGGAWDALRRLLQLVWRIAGLRRRGVRVIWTLHRLGSEPGGHPWLERIAAALVGRLADALVVHGHGARSAAAGRFAERKLHVIPYGSYAGLHPQDLPRAAARRALGLPESAIVILFFGFLRPDEGIEQLLDAHDALEGGDDVRLVIAGQAQPSAFEALLRARAAGRPRVVLRAGRVPEHEIQVLMNAADAVALPSLQPLGSSSLLLAMAYRRPIVAPRTPGVTDYLTDDQPFLYDPADPRGLADALGRAARAARRPDSLAACGERNAELDAALDWHASANATARLYRRRD